MYLVEILLPLRRNDGSAQPPELLRRVRGELVERFGGVTAFSRAPAEGLWEDESNGVERDEILVVQVMAEALERGWWSDYRARLEREFEQEMIVIRSSAVELL